jgi:hypothetical protein
VRVPWHASIAILTCVALPAHADSLDEIAAFAEKICNQSLIGAGGAAADSAGAASPSSVTVVLSLFVFLALGAAIRGPFFDCGRPADRLRANLDVVPRTQH